MTGNLARVFGADNSTTSLSFGGRTGEGMECFAATKMLGEVSWHGEPAFDLEKTPQMMLDVLDQLCRKGMLVAPGRGAISFAVRQHDMVLLGANNRLIAPALMWQCNAATKEVAMLKELGAEKVVGPIAPRFILPKLIWALNVEESLRNTLRKVMTTGDWIAFMLTGNQRLSKSDALSNSLLDQTTRELATQAIQAAGLDPKWFPPVIDSGQSVGKVGEKAVPGISSEWARLREMLAGWDVVSSLGDNHATGVGCGLVDDTMIITSAGTSGTVNRKCSATAILAGKANCFEFYKDRLLLMMLADCCKWYDQFIGDFAPGYRRQLDTLNVLALEAHPSTIRRVLYRDGQVIYPPHWNSLSLGQKVASTQFSIMLELLLLNKQMIAEVVGGENQITSFVLTGGLSQSHFVQQLFALGIRLLVPSARVLLSARTGPLRFQTAVSGAMLNAELPSRSQDLNALVSERCPHAECPMPDRVTAHHLEYMLQSYGL